MADGRWQMADGRWQMADGKWQMAKGEWQMDKWQSAKANGRADSRWQKQIKPKA
jgi:2-amino-4-hydroxy-6-hydroxymethyldihydropteridine diphosphokinase